MESPAAGAFIANLMRNLEKNGFPDKKVALPLERLYEDAHDKGVNLNKVLAFLAESKDVQHTKTAQKIIFHQSAVPAPDAGQPEPAADDQPDLASMMAQANEFVRNMSPEKMQEIQDMVMNMSDEQKAEIMEQAKKLGLKWP